MFKKPIFANNLLELDRRYLRMDLCLICIIAALFLFYRLGSFPLFVPDEGRYAEVARGMLRYGNWFEPKLMGVAFLDKPVLYYWISAFFMKIFGVNIWAIRAPGALFGIFGCVITYLIAGVCFSRITGIIAALCLLTSPLYFAMTHYADMDLQFAVWFSASMLCFILGLRLRNFKRLNKFLMYLMYVLSALAFLTKGLMGFVFPIFIIGLWVLLFNRWALVKYMHIKYGLCLFFLIIIPWVIVAQKQNPHFFYYFFYQQQIGRYLSLGEIFNNNMPVWFYLPVLMVGLLPWSLLSIASWPWLYKLWIYLEKSLDKKHLSENDALSKEGVVSFLSVWILVILVFFSVTEHKVVGYIAPVFIPICVLFGLYFVKYLGSACFYIYSFLNASVWIGIGTVCFDIYNHAGALGLDKHLSNVSDISLTLKFLGIFFIICAILNIVFLLFRKRLISLFIWLVMIVVFDLSAVHLAPNFNNNSVLSLVKDVKRDMAPNAIIINFGTYNEDLPVYLDRSIYIYYPWASVDISKEDNWATDFIRGNDLSQVKSRYLINLQDFYNLWNNNKAIGRQVIVFAAKSFLPSIKESLSLSDGEELKVLGQNDSEVVFTY